jgi:hypothetical protein
MAVLRYHDHYISVVLTPDKSGNSSCIPVVEIRHKRDNAPVTRLVISEAFTSTRVAKARAFETGKKWVDERYPKSTILSRFKRPSHH